jgi:Na+/melibiose symporter-like transporter
MVVFFGFSVLNLNERNSLDAFAAIGIFLVLIVPLPLARPLLHTDKRWAVVAFKYHLVFCGFFIAFCIIMLVRHWLGVNSALGQ